MDSLSGIVTFITQNPVIITLLGIIIGVVGTVIGFLVSRIWDYFSFKKSLVLEDKNLCMLMFY